MGGSAFHLPTLRRFGDLPQLAEMRHSLHRGVKARPEPGSSRVCRKWQLPPRIVQMRSPRLREGGGIQDHQLKPAQGVGPRVGLRSACLRATVVFSAHRACRSAQRLRGILQHSVAERGAWPTHLPMSWLLLGATAGL